jgi:nicotinamidase/pyrazinamidase
MEMAVRPNDVLIVIDVQNDFVSGSMAIADAQKIITPINQAAGIFDHVVIVTDWHPKDHVSFASAHAGAKDQDVVKVSFGEQMVFADHCVQGTKGAELDSGLQLTKAELIFRKGYRREVDSFGAFYENDKVTATGLGAYLHARGFNRVFCAGLARYGCVMQSALGAARDGFEVFILHNASAGDRDVEANNRLLADAGVNWITTGDLMRAAAASAADSCLTRSA